MKKLAVTVPLGVVAFIILGASSCDTSGGTPAGGSSASSGTVNVAMNQPMTANNGETVTVTAYTAGVTDANALETLPAGQECVQVKVSLKNGSGSEWLEPLGEMSIVDSSGQKYDTLNAIGTCPSGSSDISSLVANGSANATLVFEVPSTGALDFNWSPPLSGQVFQARLS